MENHPVSAESGQTFKVSFENEGVQNPDFSGQGTLTVHYEEPVYRFSGRNRGFSASPRTLNFRSDELWNVAFGGRGVQFDSRLGKSAAKGRPFIFFCETEELAAYVASRMPQTRDADFITRLNFGQQINRLPGATSRWTSVTNVIIAINVVAFVLMGLLGAGWFSPASMSPYVEYVANNGGATTDGEWWRLVTCMFVHYGVVHLALNMWALYQSGHFVEKLLGRPLFAMAYLGSGLIASFTSLFWHGDKIWSAGASGAVFGVFGIMIGFMLREKKSIPAPVLKPMMRSALMFAGYNLIFGLMLPQIDNAAHIGGLVGGLVLGWLVAMPLDPATRLTLWRKKMQLGLVTIAVISAAGVHFAPRFDYRFREELRWENVFTATQPLEVKLLDQHQARASAYQQNPAEFATWIETDALPFYTNWLAQLNAMDLTPGKSTAKRREAVVVSLNSKIAGYQTLAAKLRADKKLPTLNAAPHP